MERLVKVPANYWAVRLPAAFAEAARCRPPDRTDGVVRWSNVAVPTPPPLPLPRLGVRLPIDHRITFLPLWAGSGSDQMASG